jgi:hypothetical protein
MAALEHSHVKTGQDLLIKSALKAKWGKEWEESVALAYIYNRL